MDVMNIAEEAAFCAKLSLFDTIVCNCLLKSVSNELRDAPCPECVSADTSWTDNQHEQLPWDRSQPLSTPPGSPVTRHTTDGQTPGSTTDTGDAQTSHCTQPQLDSSECGNSDKAPHLDRACSSGGRESSSLRPRFVCYPVLLQSRRRASFTRQQVEVFERLFEKTVYPDPPILQEVADQAGVTRARLKTWFANKRSRLKKERSKMKLEEGVTPKTSPCKCRCKVKLPPLKKQKFASAVDDSACNSNTSKIYLDVDGHHLANKRGLVNSSCSCAKRTFEKEIHNLNPSPHVNSVDAHSFNTRAVSMTNISERPNSSGILPLHVNVSPLLTPSVIVSSLTCSNAGTSLSHNANLSHPHIANGHPSYQLLLTPTVFSPQYAASNGVWQGCVTNKNQNVPESLFTSNQANINYQSKPHEQNVTSSRSGATLRNNLGGIAPNVNDIKSLVDDALDSTAMKDHDHHGDASLLSNVDVHQNNVETNCHPESAELPLSNQMHMLSSVLQISTDTTLQNIAVTSSTDKLTQLTEGGNMYVNSLLNCNTASHHQTDNLVKDGNLETQFSCKSNGIQLLMERDNPVFTQMVDINNNVLHNDRILANNYSFHSNGFQELGCGISQKQTNEMCSANTNCENIDNTAASISGKDQVDVQGRASLSTHGDNLAHGQISPPCVTSIPVIAPSFTQPVQPAIPVIMNNFQINFS